MESGPSVFYVLHLGSTECLVVKCDQKCTRLTEEISLLPDYILENLLCNIDGQIRLTSDCYSNGIRRTGVNFDKATVFLYTKGGVIGVLF